MKNSFKIFTLLIIVFLFFSCSKKSAKEIYEEKSTELVTQILSDKGNSCSCLIVYDKTILEVLKEEVPNEDFEKKLFGKLNFKHKSELENSINLSMNFKIKKSMLNSKTQVLSISEFNSILIEDSNKFMKGLIDNRPAQLASMCPKGIRLMTKPVFDESYTIAYVDIQRGFIHLRNSFGTYRLTNGRWSAD